jgi:hypothetical protein
LIAELREIRGIFEDIRYSNRLAQRAALIADIERRLELPRYQDSKRLIRFGFQVSSQNYEDGMIREVFRRIGTTNKVFVEIGVGNGKENNTAFLLSQGWTGFWIDSDDRFAEELKRTDLVGAVSYRVAHVDKTTACELLASLNVPSEFDILSIDIDQNTYYIWEVLKGYRPRLVVIEYNGALPPDMNWRVRYESNKLWDGTQNFGASLKALEMLGQEMGYSLVGCDLLGVNAFFVRSDLTADEFCRPFTAENHFEPLRLYLSGRDFHPRAILDRNGV